MIYRAKVTDEEGTLVDTLFNDSQSKLIGKLNQLYISHRLAGGVRVEVDAVMRTSDNNWELTDQITIFVLDNEDDSVYN